MNDLKDATYEFTTPAELAEAVEKYYDLMSTTDKNSIHNAVSRALRKEIMLRFTRRLPVK